jgi:hypothetical protein
MIRTMALPLLLLLVGAGSGASAQSLDPEEDAVLGAVLTLVADEMVDESLLAEGGVACLNIDPGGAPQSVSSEFLEGLDPCPFLRRGAECEERPEGAVELATERPAVIITAGPIEWVAEDDAWVTVRYFRTNLLSAQRVYRAVREKTGWVSLGQIIQMSPA